jgi:hypothetical protein
VTRWLRALFAACAVGLIAAQATVAGPSGEGPSALEWSEPRVVAATREWTSVAVAAMYRSAFVGWNLETGFPGADVFVRRMGSAGGGGRRHPIDDNGRVSGGASIAILASATCVAWSDFWDYGDHGPKAAAWHRCSEDGGATWGPARRIPARSGRLLAGDQHLIHVSKESGSHVTRTSTDLGRSWSKPVPITIERRRFGSSDAWSDRRGLFFAYERGNDDARAIVVRRSLDNGKTWSSPRVVAMGKEVRFPEIASDGRTLVVTWWSGHGNRLLAAASTDFGQSWSPPARVDDTGVTHIPFELTAGERGFVAVWGRRAAGPTADVWSARSIDGQEWSQPRPVGSTPTAAYSFALAAAGDRAYLAYGDADRHQVVLRVAKLD